MPDSKTPRTPLKNKRLTIALSVLGAILISTTIIVWQRAYFRALALQIPIVRQLLHQKTVEDQIAQYGPTARPRLKAYFQEKQLVYPPEKVSLIVDKSKKEMQIYAYESGTFHPVHTYPILAASGKLGPKLKEGDYQVPEGIYCVQELEPNSDYHLALRVNYPNEIDLERARLDGRTKPGCDIMIHGSNCSAGCLAMGDPVSEELFVLAHDVKDRNIAIVIGPVDMRVTVPPAQPGAPKWLPELYADIKHALADYPIGNSNQ